MMSNVGNLVFVEPVSMVQFSEILKAFDKLWRVAFKRPATYEDFTSWLATTDLVKVENERD